MIVMADNNKAACAKCGYKPKGKFKIQSSENIEKKEGIRIIDEKKLNTYPIVNHKCAKCKNKESYFWTMQTRAADESETKFYKCTKCEHTWREYR